MAHTRLLFAILSLTLAARGADPPPTALRLLTLNVWSGLNYQGTWRMGEYETPEHRAARFDVLVEQIRELQPDVIFLQEANPASGFSRRLARALGYDEVHQVCLAGIKFGPLGIPSNLKEGNAILARRSLHLEKWDVCQQSGAFGIYGDAVTLHLDETIQTLIALVRVGDTPIFVLSTHLYATWAADSLHGQRRRDHELRALTRCLKNLPGGSPVILGGDFNTPPDAPELAILRQSGNHDAVVSSENLYTWDPRANQNIRDYYTMGEASTDTVPRRIDGFWLNSVFAAEDVTGCRLAVNSDSSGVHASDHFGLMADVNVTQACSAAPKDPPTVIPPSKPRTDLLPILMYDTNTGLGYGLKLFLLNHLKRKESLDLIFFNSTKGERWYRLVAARPDFALRQGKTYPLAVDLTADYDRWIVANFFGIGAHSRYADKEEYVRQTLDLSALASRGFTRRIVAQAGMRFKIIESSGFEAGSALEKLTVAADAGRVAYISVPLQLRYDSRNNFLTPSRGLVLQGDAEFVPRWTMNTVHFTRWSAVVQTYSVLFYPKTVLALRASVQQLEGHDLPPQVLLPLGSGWTLRGSSQDRYLDKAASYANAELRFPLLGHLSGVVGEDAGKVWPSLADLQLHDWVSNPVFGLRFNMHTFLVRLDIGLGRETTGLYFNFGHVF
jgi:endonuclease/exonuclease/phosphatase family metal-dependent hydrolase